MKVSNNWVLKIVHTKENMIAILLKAKYFIKNIFIYNFSVISKQIKLILILTYVTEDYF